MADRTYYKALLPLAPDEVNKILERWEQYRAADWSLTYNIPAPVAPEDLAVLRKHRVVFGKVDDEMLSQDSLTKNYTHIKIYRIKEGS